MNIRSPLFQFHLQPGGQILEGQDRIYGDPGQVPTLQDRWIVPKAYQRASNLLTHKVGLVNTTLAGQDTFYGASGQSPIFAVSEPILTRRPFIKDFVSVNSQSLLLTPVAENMPPGLNGVLQLFDLDPAVRVTADKALQYRQYQTEPWPGQFLIGQDNFYGDPGQVPTFKLSQPYFARLPIHAQGWQLSTALLFSAEVIEAPAIVVAPDVVERLLPWAPWRPIPVIYEGQATLWLRGQLRVQGEVFAIQLGRGRLILTGRLNAKALNLVLQGENRIWLRATIKTNGEVWGTVYREETEELELLGL